MTTRLIFTALLAASLTGCATYSNDYQDRYADGSYYSPADSGNGDYYYAPERQDSYYDGYGGGYYDYRYMLGPIGYGSFDGYCSVRYSTCAPYWYGGYGGYSPSYSRFGFSLSFGSPGWYGRPGYWRPYYGYGFRSAPIYRGRPHTNPRPRGVPVGAPVSVTPVPGMPTTTPISTGRRLGRGPYRPEPRVGFPGRDMNPGDDTATPPPEIRTRPLYREPMPRARPMPKPGFNNEYSSPRPEPRADRYREPPQQERPRPRFEAPPSPPRPEPRSAPPSSGQPQPHGPRHRDSKEASGD